MEVENPGMLVVWTPSDAQLLRRTLGASLEALRPHIPKHRFEPSTDKIVVAEADDVCWCAAPVRWSCCAGAVASPRTAL
jgi:hypothetical protein